MAERGSFGGSRLILPSWISLCMSRKNDSKRCAGRWMLTIRAGSSLAFRTECGTPAGTVAFSPAPTRLQLPFMKTSSVEVFDAVSAVRSADGALTAVVLPDGTAVPRDVLFVAAPPTPRDAAFAHLGQRAAVAVTRDL